MYFWAFMIGLTTQCDDIQYHPTAAHPSSVHAVGEVEHA